jgi:hypothetical protein
MELYLPLGRIPALSVADLASRLQERLPKFRPGAPMICLPEGLVLVRHLDEAEPAGLAAELVLDDRRGGDVAEGRERFAQLAFVQVP